jgi:SAM-dependent methyltransferase
MSSYEDYSTASGFYDVTRRAVGLEVILGCLAASGRPLAELCVVDAGCGTGNYAQALLEHVGRVEAVDLNEGMLEVAKAKLGDALAAGRVRLHRASIDALPLEPASADAAVINQVLHHLPDDAASGWPFTRRVMQELARVLKPGGVLTINTCSHLQLREGSWYTAVIPQAMQDMLDRHVPLEVLAELLSDSGFSVQGRIVPLDVILQGEHYLDGLGPTREEWRRGDSVWARVDEPTLNAVIEKLKTLHARGELEQFVERSDARRTQVGQFTFVHAVRAE